MSARPLLLLTIAFISGITAQRFHPVDLSQWWLPSTLTGALCLAVGLFRRSSGKSIPTLFLLLFFGSGILGGNTVSTSLPPPLSMEQFFDQPQTLFLCEIASPPEFHPGKTRLYLRLLKAFHDEKSLVAEGGILLTISDSDPKPGAMVLGDRLLARMTIKKFHNFNNPGGFDYERNQAEKGLYGRAYMADGGFLLKLTATEEPFLLSIIRVVKQRIDRFRQNALFWIRRTLEPDAADFFGSLLLGYPIPKSWSEHLNRTGVTHLLSISGLHLGMVSMVTFWLCCRLLRLLYPSLLKRISDRHIALWVALLVAALYSLVGGLALATWRSLLMLLLFLGGAFWYRYSDPMTALASAALAILVFSPSSLWHISFQLSFGAMFALFMVYPKIRPVENYLLAKSIPNGGILRKLIAPFAGGFFGSLGVSIVLVPILIYYFHGVSLAGFVANTILVPLVGFLVLPPGLISLGLFAINEQAAAPALIMGGWILRFCQDIILWLSNLSWAFFWVGTVPLSILICYYAGLASILSGWNWRRKTLLLMTLLVLAGGQYSLQDSPGEPERHRGLEATIIDVGQGTSALVRFPTGETMLVDGGGFLDDSFDIGQSVVAPFLWASGVRRLDHVVLSHDHPDHRNGLRFILSYFDVGSFWTSGISEPRRGFDELAELASRRAIPIMGLDGMAHHLSIGACEVNFVHPSARYVQEQGYGKNLNNASLVLDIQYHNTHLILPGDIDQSVEHIIFNDFTASGQTLLLSPHHGSELSNSTLLFDRVQPYAMVFSCGYDNWFGFPASPVLDECGKRGILFFRTDLNGAIRARSDGSQWDIQPYFSGK